MSEKFTVLKSLETYITLFNNITSNHLEIPVYIDDDRRDLTENIKLSYEKSLNYSILPIYKSDYGLVISDSVNYYEKSSIFCNKWIQLNQYACMNSETSLVIIGLYKDFTQKKMLNIISYCQKNSIQINLLIARDKSSLSWLIAKQFIQREDIKTRKGVFSLLNLNKDTSKNWQIFGARDLDKYDIKDILLRNKWSNLILHGHGKEDHLNLNDFTLSSLKNNLKETVPFAPAIGHKNQSFFKDISKAILIKKINVDKLYILSCNNFPFFDSKLYDPKYNIVLDAIEGLTQRIVASLSVQSADTPELSLIMDNYNCSNIASKLNDSLSDISPMVSIVQIGLPRASEEVSKSEIKTYRLPENTRNILSRISFYFSSMMLNENHSIYKMSKKIFSDYIYNINRGKIKNTPMDFKNFEQELVNRINPLSNKIAEIMFLNPNDDLHNFDNFNTYRSVLVKDSIELKECVCGGRLTSCMYKPEISTGVPIESSYCYRCGDKSAKRYI
ncbi:hypothetical protein J2Z60_001899 [Lactobacillus colini]|uniref:Uncharacterized protein n=1 Tax=Lactobacillus colini TaxID=1819254 RepID=A0ABS4MG86_9LACO|nr:hypothetical protein [Lactobacillus colini]MBP2058710.1 hypothetical protein [Lactobacillus colini]